MRLPGNMVSEHLFAVALQLANVAKTQRHPFLNLLCVLLFRQQLNRLTVALGLAKAAIP